MVHSFKHSLKKRFFTVVSLSALATSFLLLILLFGFSYFLQKQQLTKDTQQIVQHIRDMKQANYQLLETMNQKMVPEFLEGKHTDRENSLVHFMKQKLNWNSVLILSSLTTQENFSLVPIATIKKLF